MTITFRKIEYVALALGAASGSLVFGAMPVAVGAIVTVFGGAAKGGLAAATELGAMGAASVLVSARLRHLRGRSTAFVAVSFMIFGYALSAVALARTQWLALLGGRALVGFGEGALYTLSNAFAAKSPRPDRTFTGIAFVQTALIALFYLTMTVLNSSYDPVRVFFVFTALTTIAALPLAGMPPYRAGADQQGEVLATRTPFTPIVRQVLIGFGVFGIALFMLYPYVEAIGILRGFSPVQIATILGFTSIAALVGPALTAAIGLRFGRLAPVMVAVGFQVAASLVLVYSTNLFLWGGAELASVALLYVLNPMLFGLVAHIEPSGSATAVAAAIMSLTAAIGPALSGVVTTFTQGYEALGWCNAIAYLVMLAVLWGPQRNVDRTCPVEA